MDKINNIGTQLKNARLNQKLELNDIAQSTKININVLRAIEESDFSKLPSMAYVRGFILTYAKELQLIPDEVFAEFKVEYDNFNGKSSSSFVPTPKPKQAPEKPSEKEESHIDFSDLRERIISTASQFISKRVIIVIVAIVVLFIIIKMLITFIGNLSAENVMQNENEKEVITIAPPTLKPESANILEMDASKKFAVKLSSEKEIKEAKPTEEKVEEILKKEIKPELKKIETKTEKPIKKVKLPAGKLPFKKFYPAPSKIYTIINDSEEAKDINLLPSNIKAAVIPGKQNVYIKAVDGDTWISYQSDDDEIKRFVLKKGRWVLIKGERVLLFMGNLNVTRIFLNNQFVRAESRTGVKSFIFPQELASEYQYPLFPSYKGIPYKASSYKENMVEESPN